MNVPKPNLSLIHGGRDEIERELVRLVLTTFPVPADEDNRLLSMLEPRSGRVSIALAEAGFSQPTDAWSGKRED